jgi:hypothetical protein
MEKYKSISSIVILFFFLSNMCVQYSFREILSHSSLFTCSNVTNYSL